MSIISQVTYVCVIAEDQNMLEMKPEILNYKDGVGIMVDTGARRRSRASMQKVIRESPIK